MPAFRPRIRALAVGAGAFALIAVAAGGTFAASNPATLYACYDAYGNVRMGDTAQCKLPGGGRLVNWSTAGVPGPTGPTGATGPTGPTGAQGAPGTGSGVHHITLTAPDDSAVVFSGAVFAVELGCHVTATQRIGSYEIVNLSGSSLTYALVHGNVPAIAAQVAPGGGTGSSWDAAGYTGTTNLWVTGGGESFYAEFVVYGVPGSGTCQVFATY